MHRSSHTMIGNLDQALAPVNGISVGNAVPKPQSTNTHDAVALKMIRNFAVAMAAGCLALVSCEIGPRLRDGVPVLIIIMTRRVAGGIVCTSDGQREKS